MRTVDSHGGTGRTSVRREEPILNFDSSDWTMKRLGNRHIRVVCVLEDDQKLTTLKASSDAKIEFASRDTGRRGGVGYRLFEFHVGEIEPIARRFVEIKLDLVRHNFRDLKISMDTTAAHQCATGKKHQIGE
jgi:hypothetical protein